MRSAFLALIALLLVPAVATADVSGPEIVSFLNAQRAANGIPAGITEDPALSDGCAKANAYNARNNTITHEEDASAPGYTAEGAQAARTSVLYGGGGPWSATNNPFETAPIHLHQLLAPRIDHMGASENGGYGCATTQAPHNRPAPPKDITYTYPGDGAKNWPLAQTAAEFPQTPGQAVGIGEGATTGPYLYAMFDGPKLSGFEDASDATGSLRGPGGTVPVAVVDNGTPVVGGYLPTGAEIIPRDPLAPATNYTASISAKVDGSTFSRSWTFTTADGPLPYEASVRRKGKRKIRVKVTAKRALALVAKGAGKRVAQELAAGETYAETFLASKAKVVITVAGARYVER